LVEQDSYLPAANRNEYDTRGGEKKMCRSMNIECGLRLRRMRNGYVKKNQ